MLSTPSLRCFVATVSCCILAICGYGQASYNKAHSALSKGNYVKAQELFKELLKDGSENPFHHLEAGLSYWYSTAEREKSIPHFKNALVHFKPDTVYETLFYLGQALHYKGDFKESKKYLELFKTKLDNSRAGQNLTNACDKYLAACEVGMKLSENRNKDIEPVTLGSLNTAFPEYAPIIRPGTSVMLFTTRRKSNEGNKVDLDAQFMEDVRAAEFNGNTWSELTDKKSIESHYPIKFNTKRHEGCIYYSPDGKKLWLYKNDHIWVSENENNTWKDPMELPVVINMKKTFTPSATFSADLSTMYFVSERKDGSGKRDLYRTKKNGENWSEPEELTVLNTKLDEDAPLLSKDGKTLYFSSQGHNSSGGFDVFKADVAEDGTISNVTNMGYPINSPADDIYFFTVDEEDFYLASDRMGTKGDMDIYHYTQKTTPDSIYLSVLVRVMPDSKPTGGTLTTSSRENEQKGHMLSDDGVANTMMLRNDTVNLNVSPKEMADHSFVLKGLSVQDSSNILLELTPFRSFTGKTYKQVLKASVLIDDQTVIVFDTVMLDTADTPKQITQFDPVYFDFDYSRIPADEKSKLEPIAKYLKANKEVLIDITGHTDSWGPENNPEKYNDRLSRKRARNVYQYLRSKGISSSRMKTSNVGASQPAVPNKPQTKEDPVKGTKENRRVSFKLYATPTI